MRQIAIRMPTSMLDAIDAIIAERHGQGDRTQVMRELIAEAIELRQRKKSRS